MIINVDNKRALGMPRAEDFKRLRGRLSAAEFDAAVDHINGLIDGAGDGIATAGWLPGNDWSGSPLQPIYDKAARGDYSLSGKFFGLLVWYTVMERPEKWATGKYKKDGREIASRTYFRVRT